MKTHYRQRPRRISTKLRYRVDTAASALGVPPRSLRYSIHVGLVPVVCDGSGIFILADVLSSLKAKTLTQNEKN